MDQTLTMNTIKTPFFLIHENKNNKNRTKNVPICSNVFLGAFILLRKNKGKVLIRSGLNCQVDVA
jgi:hypothetical protein